MWAFGLGPMQWDRFNIVLKPFHSMFYSFVYFHTMRYPNIRTAIKVKKILNTVDFRYSEFLGTSKIVHYRQSLLYTETLYAVNSYSELIKPHS